MADGVYSKAISEQAKKAVLGSEAHYFVAAAPDATINLFKSDKHGGPALEVKNPYSTEYGMGGAYGIYYRDKKSGDVLLDHDRTTLNLSQGSDSEKKMAVQIGKVLDLASPKAGPDHKESGPSAPPRPASKFAP